MKRARTHYDNLKVSRDAPIEVIQAAYRSLARKHHPDRTGGSPESDATMQAINAAYEVLSDPEARAKYDQWMATEMAQPPGSDSPERGSRRRSVSGGDVLVLVGCFVVALSLLRFPGVMRLIGIGVLLAGVIHFFRQVR